MTLHCYRIPSWPTLVIDQDPERKSTTRMKKPTQRPQKLDFNCCPRHLVLISLVCCFCLRGLGFVRKISLFFVFMGFWVWSFSVFCLCGFLYLIFLCFFVFVGFMVFCLFACVHLCVWSFDLWVFYRLEFPMNFTEIKYVILTLLQWTWISMTLDVSFLNNLKTMLTNKIVWKLVLFWEKKIHQWSNKYIMHISWKYFQSIHTTYACKFAKN